MKIRIEGAENLREYINWYIGKSFNIPMLKERLRDAQRMIKRYYEDELIVELKLP